MTVSNETDQALFKDSPNEKISPPSMKARTDLNRGVWKVPAGLETTILNMMQHLFHVAQREVAKRGIVAWAGDWEG